MKILILSWRDIKNPFAGGAEIFTYENAKRWVASGHEVTWFTSDFGDNPKEELIGGIQIIRRGSETSVHYHAFRHYNKFFKGKFDLVIDEINTIPFFTPLYIKEKKIALIFQLARGVWFYEAFFPLSLIGFIMEFLYLKFYRKTPVITISESTKEDLLNLGFSNKISILPIGISFKPLAQLSQKEPRPSLVYVGRLRKSKRVHHIIEALKIIKKAIPNIQLNVIGKGGRPHYIKKLHYLISKYDLQDNVNFYGYVDELTKHNLIKKAHALMVTSVREGWGLVVSEANALSTIAIGYNVHGLRDSIIDGQTGLLTAKNNPFVLAETVLNFFKDPLLCNRLSNKALQWSRRFSWETSAQDNLEALKRIISDNLDTPATPSL